MCVLRHTEQLFFLSSFLLIVVHSCVHKQNLLNNQAFSGITTLCLDTQTSLSPFSFIFLSFVKFIIAYLKQKFLFCDQQVLFF